MDLADAVHQLVNDALRTHRKTGVVTATAGTRVVVTIDGATMTLPRLASYTHPVAGDVVHIDTTVPGAWLIVGSTA